MMYLVYNYTFFKRLTIVSISEQSKKYYDFT